jgi:ketosteroid isomerase-like protein
MTAALKVAQQFYEAAGSGDEAALSGLVSPSITFRGPMAKADGIEEYARVSSWFQQVLKGTHVHSMVASDENVVTIYDLEVEAPDGKRFMIPTADWLTVKDGNVVSQRVFYDPRELAAAFPE